MNDRAMRGADRRAQATVLAANHARNFALISMRSSMRSLREPTGDVSARDDRDGERQDLETSIELAARCVLEDDRLGFKVRK